MLPMWCGRGPLLAKRSVSLGLTLSSLVFLGLSFWQVCCISGVCYPFWLVWLVVLGTVCWVGLEVDSSWRIRFLCPARDFGVRNEGSYLCRYHELYFLDLCVFSCWRLLAAAMGVSTL